MVFGEDLGESVGEGFGGGRGVVQDEICAFGGEIAGYSCANSCNYCKRQIVKEGEKGGSLPRDDPVTIASFPSRGR